MIAKTVLSGIRGIVLDAVGTLIDPWPPVAVAYAEEARRQGVVLDPAEVKSRFYQHFGQDEGDEARGPLATDEAVEHRRWRRIVANVLPEVPDPEAAFSRLWEHFGNPASWRTFRDVGRSVHALQRAGLHVGVASNFDRRLRGVLAGLPDLAGWADRAVISSEVGFRKPHPAFYQAACQALGLPPEAVLHVGDDPENDLRGPARVGMPAVLIGASGRPADEPSLASLTALVERLAEAGRGPSRPDWRI
jgi:putative hydrolase of the HAD superfamily